MPPPTTATRMALGWEDSVMGALMVEVVVKSTWIVSKVVVDVVFVSEVVHVEVDRNQCGLLECIFSEGN